MSLSASFIRSLSGDAECREALVWLARQAPKYPSGTYTPPLAGKLRPDGPTKFVSLAIRLGRKSRSDGGTRATRMDLFDGSDTTSFVGTDSAMATQFAKRALSRHLAGYLLVTTGQRRHSLEAWLDSVGRGLLSLGYSLQPCVGSQGVQFIKIRKGKRSWTIAYFETITGVSLSAIEPMSTAAGQASASSTMMAPRIFAATAAVQTFYLEHFGVALSLTAGMTAMRAARMHLPPDLKKWRPTPLLVAMERAGRGYRGGMTYAARYKGPSWRIDVNRQYTHALRSELPWKVAFGRYKSESETPHGVFMCRVQLSSTLPYPLGIWSGQDRGFVTTTAGRGTYVCCLHTSEFPGLIAAGATITPGYGYIFTNTFSLTGFVDAIQAVLHTFGKDSAQGRLTKPLGNYVYGKFGQNPTRTELLFSLADPGQEWFPYWDDLGEPHEELWERKQTRYTASQHVDIAGTITGTARSQTALTWAWLSASGATVVRCHTDSLTLDSDPAGLLDLSNDTIGAWRLERADVDTVIIGPNAYIDGETAHIAGVSEPTYEMVEQMYDGQVIRVSQDVTTPLRSLRRGVVRVEREYRAKAAKSP